MTNDIKKIQKEAGKKLANANKLEKQAKEMKKEAGKMLGGTRSKK